MKIHASALGLGMLLLSFAVACGAPSTSEESGSSQSNIQAPGTRSSRCAGKPSGSNDGNATGKDVDASAPTIRYTNIDGKPAAEGKPEATDDDDCLTEEEEEIIRKKKEAAAAAGIPCDEYGNPVGEGKPTDEPSADEDDWGGKPPADKPSGDPCAPCSGK